MNISIFSGGRGNKNLFRAFAEQNSNITLNVLVNGLDDGASTGDIRRLLDNRCHGISDFLKTITAFSNNPIVDLMETRFPKNNDFLGRIRTLSMIQQFIENSTMPKFLEERAAEISDDHILFIKQHLLHFLENIYKFKEELVDLSDYKIGNIIFASILIKKDLDFRAALDSFCEVCQISNRVRIIEASKLPLNLVGILKNGTLLPNEASIVLSRTTDLIHHTYQVSNPLSLNQIRKISSLEVDEKIRHLNLLEVKTKANVELLSSLKNSNLIVYGAGTPYSSILPSLEYSGVADEIAANDCPKLLIANLQKETDNYLGTSALIGDILKFLAKSSTTSHSFDRLLTHVLVSTNNNVENSIACDVEALKRRFPSITIIRGDFNHPVLKGTHDGTKVLHEVMNLL